MIQFNYCKLEPFIQKGETILELHSYGIIMILASMYLATIASKHMYKTKVDSPKPI